jgi:hypothetical protein
MGYFHPHLVHARYVMTLTSQSNITAKIMENLTFGTHPQCTAYVEAAIDINYIDVSGNIVIGKSILLMLGEGVIQVI